MLLPPFIAAIRLAATMMLSFRAFQQPARQYFAYAYFFDAADADADCRHDAADAALFRFVSYAFPLHFRHADFFRYAFTAWFSPPMISHAADTFYLC